MRCTRCNVARATVEVVNNRNNSCGKFCRRCGEKKVNELNKAEKKGKEC